MTGTPLGRRGTKGKAGAPTDEITVTLAGNPNVGKSTLFNALTGLDQHTGNWPGKTVASADGRLRYRGKTYRLVDTPGTYSLAARSPEEEVTRDFLCYGDANVTVVVCDATCLARNLHLVLQILAFSPRAVVCINLMDEAARRGIAPDLDALSHRLGVPVVGTVARRKKTLAALMEAVEKVAAGDAPALPALPYPAWLTAEQATLATLLARVLDSIRAQALVPYLLSGDAPMPPALAGDDTVLRALAEAKARLAAAGHDEEDCHEAIALALAEKSGELYAATVTQKNEARADRDRRLDRFFTGRRTAYPVMLLLLLAILFLTIVGANYPSAWLSAGLSRLLDGMAALLISLHAPPWLYGALIDGVFCVLFRVVAVMLPPMAIFFPLFTLLEDFGLLPRIAFNLDGLFQKAGAHGKQALTTCMGFGCNAAGVTACRIIESPRERLIAILTNSFVPCNGRFPTLILLAGFFLAQGDPIAAGGFVFLLIILSVAVTLGVSFFLSKTILKGLPSAFVLELPPYRRPKIGEVIVRSVLDRTAFVLGRAITVAIPAGAVIWLCQNVEVGGHTLLYGLTTLLEPLGSLMGLSGVILAAFLLGIPANEIVIPILLMVYSQSGMLVEAEGMAQAGAILQANGWTWVTAICTILFSLNQFPCATTLLTIRNEPGSWLWTGVSFLLPTAVGIFLCMMVNLIAHFAVVFF